MTEANDKILEELKRTNFLLAFFLFKEDQKEMEYDSKLEILDSLGLTQTEIGKIVGKDRTTVNKELKNLKKKDTKNKRNDK